MAKKRFASSARATRAARSAKRIPDRSSRKQLPDRRIDFSDIPESTAEELQRASRVGRPPWRPKTGKAKQLIAIRFAPRLLAQLRRLAARQSKPYQTLIHEMLERATKRRVA